MLRKTFERILLIIVVFAAYKALYIPALKLRSYFKEEYAQCEQNAKTIPDYGRFNICEQETQIPLYIGGGTVLTNYIVYDSHDVSGIEYCKSNFATSILEKHFDQTSEPFVASVIKLQSNLYQLHYSSDFPKGHCD